MSIQRLSALIKQKNSRVCLGLDPKLDYLPQSLIDESFTRHGKSFSAAAESIFHFNKSIIDSVYDLVPCVKPQLAYYEMYGYLGMKALHDTVQYAKSKGLYVILDGKRNDIGDTCQAYSSAYLGNTTIGDEVHAAYGGDSLTVNPYLGEDGIIPFILPDKSIFVLVKTSNKSSGQLQDLEMGVDTLYKKVGALVDKLGKDSIGESGYSNVGAVVGATYPEQLVELRAMLPNTFFLIPGYGAQGGSASALAAAFDKNGGGAVVNASRSIMLAYKAQDKPAEAFAEAARAEVIRMNEDINQIIK